MKLIAPGKISGEIFNVIDEADKFVVLVSPYIRISDWPKLTTRLKKALGSGIRLKIYVRDGQRNLASIDELKSIGITPYLIPNLHSKLYFNEKGAVITSMNLLKSSDEYSLEIGHKVEKKEEYNGIVSYYKRYIHPHEENKYDFDTTLEDEIRVRVSERFPKLRIHSGFNYLQINTGYNRFDARISQQKSGYFLEVSAILSVKEFEERYDLLNNYEFPEHIGLNFIKGNSNSYDMVIGYLDKSIESKQISDILNSEKNIVADMIAAFLENIESFKLINR